MRAEAEVISRRGSSQKPMPTDTTNQLRWTAFASLARYVREHVTHRSTPKGLASNPSQYFPVMRQVSLANGRSSPHNIVEDQNRPTVGA
jgi:hypothetical protein